MLEFVLIAWHGCDDPTPASLRAVSIPARDQGMTVERHNARDLPGDSRGIVQALRQWTVARALPLWSDAGYDHVRGGFQEYLRPDGTPDPSATRRLRVQARQIYVYAHAAALGWYPSGRDIALAGVE